jgi:hypothetical protein
MPAAGLAGHRPKDTMTDQDHDTIFATMCRHAHEILAGTKSDSPTVSLDELEAHSEVGFYDLRKLCEERPDALKAAGLGFDGKRFLYPADNPPLALSPEPTDDAPTWSSLATRLLR